MVVNKKIMSVLILLLNSFLIHCGDSETISSEKNGTYDAGVSFINGSVSDGEGDAMGGECTSSEIGMGECDGSFLNYCDESGTPRTVDCEDVGEGYECVETIEGLDCFTL